MQRWIHIAGIAGRATSSVAIMYRQLGYFVTGSDNNCLPPATDVLDKNEIPYIKGFHYSHLTKEFWEDQLGKKLDIPDLPERAIFVATLTTKNKEYMFAKLKGIRIQTYAQSLGEDLVKSESIVSVGTAGKTTTAALMTHILQGLGFEPSYMIGAELANGEPSIINNDSDWSVMEGDEFYGVNLEPHAKFFEYSPKYVILNKLEWDHADVYPTEQDYIETFRELLKQLPADGLVIANAGDKNIRSIAASANCQVKWFSAYGDVDEFINADNKKLYWHLNSSPDSDTFMAVSYEPVPFEFEFKTKLLGEYNQQNVLAVIALLYELFANNIDWQKVANLISSFAGINKRLELLHSQPDLVVVDDLGGPPLKVKSGLEALNTKYREYYKVVVYEPNTGNRTKQSIPQYAEAFALADQIIIPSLSDHDPSLLSDSEIVSEMEQLGIEGVEHIDSAEIVNFLQTLVRDRDGRSDVAAGTTDVKESQQPILIVFFSPFRLTALARELVADL